MNSNPNAKHALAMERRAYAVFLRRRGFSYARIAVEVTRRCMGNPAVKDYDGPELTMEHLPNNYGADRAWKDVSAVFKSYAEKMNEDVVPLRAELEDQLTGLIQICLEKAVSGDLYAVQVALQGIQTKARLLGLNAPERKEISGIGGGRILISTLHERLAAAEDPDDEPGPFVDDRPSTSLSND